METKMSIFIVLLCAPILVVCENDDLQLLKDKIKLLEEKFEKQEQNFQEAMKIIAECQNVGRQHDTQNGRNQRQVQVGTNVAFSARLTKSTSGMGQHQAIIFDHVVTNDGNGYRATDGIFVVPTSGMYVFTWTISTSGGPHQSAELIKEGQVFGYSYADSIHTSGDNDYGTSSNTVVIKALRGDHVWIRTGVRGDGVLDGNNLDTFSGWLLYETE